MEDVTHGSLSQPLGRIFSRTAKLFLKLIHEKLGNLDIERSYYALILIDSGRGLLTQKELADYLEIDKVSVVRIVDYLSGKGYVKRVINSIDRRKYSLTLTDKAQEKLPEIKAVMEEVTIIAYEGLTEMQKTAFISLLDIVKNNLSKANNSGL